jgi:hypothetical protein
MISATVTLLMPLVDEGTEVWRSVAAERLDDATFRIVGPQPEGERWVFAPGTAVAARSRVLSDGKEHLVAVLPS